jgi:hypothetical protein
MYAKNKNTYRPDEQALWQHINTVRVENGLEPYRLRLQEQWFTYRAQTPIPDQAEQDEWAGESDAWNPGSATPKEGTDIEGKRIQLND